MATTTGHAVRIHRDVHDNPNRPFAYRDAIDCNPRRPAPILLLLGAVLATALAGFLLVVGA